MSDWNYIGLCILLVVIVVVAWKLVVIYWTGLLAVGMAAYTLRQKRQGSQLLALLLFGVGLWMLFDRYQSIRPA